MRRRTVLALLAGISGCLGSRDSERATSTTPGTSSTTTRTTTTETTTTERTTRTPTTATDDTTTEAVVVENRTNAEQMVDAEVRQGGDRLVGGRFRVPAGVGLRFDRRFEWGSYVVRGRLADGEWREMDWSPRSCASSPHPDGDRNAGVVVSSDGVELLQNVCDYLKLGKVYVDEYRPASDYRVEATTSA